MVGYDAPAYTHDTTTQPPKLNVAIVNGALALQMTYKLPLEPERTVYRSLKSIHKQGKARRKLLKAYRVNRHYNKRVNALAAEISVQRLRSWAEGFAYVWVQSSGGGPIHVEKKSIWQRIGERL